MNKQQLQQSVDLVAKDLVDENVDLWLGVKTKLSEQARTSLDGSMKNKPGRYTLRSVTISAAVLALLAALFFFTPQGRVLAQEITNFFHRAPEDTLPKHSMQITQAPTDQTPTPDPASILDAHASVEEVASMAGFKIYQPVLIPDGFIFSGGSFDTKTSIARLFFQSVESNGIVLKQQPIGSGEVCDLCGEVGASAEIVEVSINGVRGEYVVGVWKLTDGGTVWDADPYLQTLRWQQDGFAFEIMYMGSPEALTMEQMVGIASSLQ